MKPVFQDSSIVQVTDSKGRLHAFAVAEDSSIWHFREPDQERYWVVERLGGKAAGAPSTSFAESLDLQLWMTGADGSIWTNVQNKATENRRLCANHV